MPSFSASGSVPIAVSIAPGTELAGFWQSLEFVEALKHGDPPAVGDRVVVLGGGNTAIDVARESVRLGAAHVTLAYRRTRELMPAYAFEVDEAAEEGVAFEWLAAPVELLGVTASRRVALRSPAASASPTRPAGTRSSRRANASCCSQTPSSRRSGRAAQPELRDWRPRRRARRDRRRRAGRTSLPHVYAGGDAVNGGASVVQAVAEGRRAARAIEEDLCRA